MLDLSDPQTQHIFRAAALEDEIRKQLVAIKKDVMGSEHSSRYLDIVSRVIPALRRLNEEHFGSSYGITKHLDDISAAATQNNLDLCWKHFLALADSPGDNFGTWAI